MFDFVFFFSKRNTAHLNLDRIPENKNEQYMAKIPINPQKILPIKRLQKIWCQKTFLMLPGSASQPKAHCLKLRTTRKTKKDETS